MTMLATELNLLKFECPHCGQRIACELAHAGRPMVCPTCQGGLQIPWASVSEPQLTLRQPAPPPDSGAYGGLDVSPLTRLKGNSSDSPQFHASEMSRLQPPTPTAARVPLYPRPTHEDFWTEAEWNRRLARESREEVMGFFTLQGQMYYAALYAIITLHAGIWLGWQDAHELVGAPGTALGDPTVFGRLPETNAAFWMLVAGAILTGHGIARNPHLMPFGLPYPSGTLWRRRRWWKEEKPEDSKRMDWGSAWVAISTAAFFAELVICLFGGFFCALVKGAVIGW